MTQRVEALTLPQTERHAPRSALAGAVALPLLLAAVQLANPELDPSWRPISEYALGRHGWLMTLAFLAWGLSPLALATAVRRDVVTRGGRIGLGLLGLGAAGPLLAALFPMDPLDTPAGGMTTGGAIHAGSAVLGDLLPIGALVQTGSHVVRLRALPLSDRWDAGVNRALATLQTPVRLAA